MKAYKYDNQRRIALSTHTWRRLKKYKKWYKHKSMESCIIELLDKEEYGIVKEVRI